MKPLLSHETMLHLIQAAQTGDSSARERLVIGNMALVKSIVKRYLGRGTEYEDLAQIGTIGLLKAIDGYNAAYNVRFSTYAVPMIAGEIKRFLRDDGTIKVSRHLKEDSIKIFRAAETLKNQFGREPTIEEIAGTTGLSAEEITLATDAVRAPVSIDSPFSPDNPDSSLLDTLASPEDDSAIEKLLLKQLIATLGPRERQVIMLRYFSDKTQSEIADILHISQVQVSRMLQKILEKLKKSVSG